MEYQDGGCPLFPITASSAAIGRERGRWSLVLFAPAATVVEYETGAQEQGETSKGVGQGAGSTRCGEFDAGLIGVSEV